MSKQVASVTAEQFGHVYIDGVPHNPVKVRRFMSMGDGIRLGDTVIYEADADRFLTYIKNAKYAEGKERELVKQFVKDRALREAGFDVTGLSEEILEELAEEGMSITNDGILTVQGGKVTMEPLWKNDEERLAAGCLGSPDTCGFLGSLQEGMTPLCLAEWVPGSAYHPFCPKFGGAVYEPANGTELSPDAMVEDLDPELVDVFNQYMKKDMSILLQSSLKAAIELYKDVPMSSSKRHAIKAEAVAIALWIDRNSTQVMDTAQNLYNIENAQRNPKFKKEAQQ